MQVSRKLIENVGELKKALNEISVYDFDVYTSMELYYKIANKLNEVIKELMRFEGLVSDEVIKQNEKLIYLLGEGLNTEVVKKINQMIADGTMDTIINHNVFNSLNNKIEDYKDELSSQIKDVVNTIENINIDVSNNSIVNCLMDGSDEVAKLQQIHDYIVAKGKGTIFIPNGTLTIKDTFNLNLSKVKIKGNGATILSDINDTTKYAIVTNGIANNPYDQNDIEIEGIALKCKYQGSSKGINLNGCSHTTLSKMKIEGFRVGINYGDNVYCINHYNVDILNSTVVAINVSDESKDTGERIYFNGCTIYNNELALRSVLSTSCVVMEGCSIDYNKSQFNVSAGKVFCNNCHFEQRGNEGATSFIINGNGTLVSIKGGWILYQGAEITIPYFVLNNASGKGGMFIDGAFINNLKTLNKKISDGVGRTIITNSRGYNIFDNTLYISDNENLLYDGSFEKTLIVDDIYILEDTTEITTKTLNGSNITLETSNDFRKIGNKSLKVKKKYGSGSKATFTVVVPILNNSFPYIKFSYLNPSSATGNISISYNYGKYNDYGKPISVYESIGAQTITLSSNQTEWNEVVSGSNFKRCPSWATHIVVNISLFEFSGLENSIYFDDFVVNTW